MRIISGKLKARRFSIPKKFPSRPTTDFAKEGLFNILGNIIDLDQLEIADLCCGTGNITLEFVSREAGNVTSVDLNALCLRHLMKLAKEFDVDKEINLIKEDMLQFLERTTQTFDIIFADPPYEYKHYPEIIEVVFRRKLLKPDGLLILEHGKFTNLSDAPHYQYSRTYGNVIFSFFEVEQENEQEDEQ